MDVFGGYAHFYDILYQDKDYSDECDHLQQVFARYAQSQVTSILDLGCGTGGHALILAQRGYQVAGVDRSEAMLAAARDKASSNEQVTIAPSFHLGDVRNFDFGHTVDVVIAMFAVMGYMTTNEGLLKALQTARRHLQVGGLFYFDAWFGPAVLIERPAERYKIVDNGQDRIIRFAHPEIDLLTHRVDVHYKVLRIKDKHIMDEIDEVHSMRYLFPLEIEHYLHTAGFHLLRLSPFLQLDDELRDCDWNMQVVAQAKGI